MGGARRGKGAGSLIHKSVRVGGGPDGCFCVRFAFDPVLGGFRRIWVLSALLSSSSGPASGLGFPVGAHSTAEQPSQYSPEVCSILPEQHHGLRNAPYANRAGLTPFRAHPALCRDPAPLRSRPVSSHRPARGRQGVRGGGTGGNGVRGGWGEGKRRCRGALWEL